MSKVFIEESTLTDIGDALRRRHGETKMGTVIVDEVVPDVVVSKTPNATGFDSFSGVYHDGLSESEEYIPIQIPNATSIKVKIAYHFDGYDYMYLVDGYYSTYREWKDADVDNSPNKKFLRVSPGTYEYIFRNTDAITIKTLFYISSSEKKYLGYYAEVYGLDKNNNPLGSQTIQVEKEVEVENKYNPLDMPKAIDDIKAESEELPEKAFLISGICQYKFSWDNWNWFIEEYGDKIITQDITNAAHMFYMSDLLERIPFTLNFKDVENISMSNCFRGTHITEAPILNVPNAKKINIANLLSNSNYLRNANCLFENEEEFGASWQSHVNTTAYSNHYCSNLFDSCYSLRNVPTWFYLLKLNPESTTYIGATNTLYYYTFSSCYVLDEIKNIPVWKCKGTQTSNMFNNTFKRCGRLKEITFEKNSDSTSVVTEWKSQTIDLTSYVGYIDSISYITNYNSGITADKQVKDDTTYQALKDDADCFTLSADYSRYNHDSAVNTINSLPDTSAYLASAGGTNTIKFKGAQGGKTDGGAISDLTAEEIAIATAKGWTVTLV